MKLQKHRTQHVPTPGPSPHPNPWFCPFPPAAYTTMRQDPASRRLPPVLLPTVYCHQLRRGMVARRGRLAPSIPDPCTYAVCELCVGNGEQFPGQGTPEGKDKKPVSTQPAPPQAWLKGNCHRHPPPSPWQTPSPAAPAHAVPVRRGAEGSTRGRGCPALQVLPCFPFEKVHP